MNVFLFLTCAVVWGTTWLAITYQLGTVDPMVSIVYRFALAAAALFVFSIATRKKLRFSLRDHLFFFLSGAFMFCFNYLAVYSAEAVLPSGLVAVTMTSLIFLNAVNNRIFLKAKVVAKTLIGGLLGVVGLGLIFYPEVASFSMDGSAAFALVLSLTAALSASLGNTAAQVCHQRSIPVIQMQAYSMAYGAGLMAAGALVRAVPFTFEVTAAYIGSLTYLAVFGSVVAFMSYLTLLKNIGSDKAAYITLVSPLVALLISTIFEGYTWTAPALVGILFIMAGNAVALRKRTARAGKYREK